MSNNPGGVSTWLPDDQEKFFKHMRAMGAVLFGADRDGGFTTRAKADLGPALTNGSVLFVPCDRGAEEAEACTRAGVRITPTLVAGGESVPGATLKEVVDLISAPQAVASALGSRGVELFGRDTCVWTRRQKAVLGVAGGEKVPYVNCEDGGVGERRCAALGINAVPTWGFMGGKVLLPGYRTLAGLGALGKMSDASLQAEGRKGVEQMGGACK